MKQHVTTQEGYDRWSAVYEEDENPLTTLETPLLMEALGPEVKGLKILDLGCGTGRHAIPLAQMGAQVTAMDFSEGMLGRARAKPGADKIQFHQHDLTERLPVEGPFDRVISSLVLEHIPILEPFFTEAKRVCHDRGVIFMTAMHPAMFLKGTQAGFVDPETGLKTHPKSYPHQICDFLNAGLKVGLELKHIQEYAGTNDLAERKPRAAKYVGWPMLLTMTFAP